MMNMLKNVAEAFTPVLTESHFSEVRERREKRERRRRTPNAGSRWPIAHPSPSTRVLCCLCV